MTIFVASVLAGQGRTLFNITFENPPHEAGIASDKYIVPPADMPWEAFGINSIVTNYPGMSGQSAFIDLGWMALFFGSDLPPYQPLSTSGLNVISWKVAITQWTATQDNPSSGLTYQWQMRTESLASGDPYLNLRFEYFGGTCGVVRISHGSSYEYDQIATYTTGITYSVTVGIDLDLDTYSVWFDGVQVLTNKASGPWQEIMDIGVAATAEGDRVIDDLSWTVIDRPQIALYPDGYISWNSDSGITYRVESTTELIGGEWTNTGIEVVASNATSVISEPDRNTDRQFYRLKATE